MNDFGPFFCKECAILLTLADDCDYCQKCIGSKRSESGTGDKLWDELEPHLLKKDVGNPRPITDYDSACDEASRSSPHI